MEAKFLEKNIYPLTNVMIMWPHIFEKDIYLQIKNNKKHINSQNRKGIACMCIKRQRRHCKLARSHGGEKRKPKERKMGFTSNVARHRKVNIFSIDLL